MKRKQCAIKTFDFSDYDFSDCVEITGGSTNKIPATSGNGASSYCSTGSSSSSSSNTPASISQKTSLLMSTITPQEEAALKAREVAAQNSGKEFDRIGALAEIRGLSIEALWAGALQKNTIESLLTVMR